MIYSSITTVVSWLSIVFPSTVHYNPGEKFNVSFNTLRPRQDGRHFQMHFLEWNAWILITISLKFVPEGPINNIPPWVQIMAWHLSGDKPLSGSLMALFTYAYMHHSASVS